MTVLKKDKEYLFVDSLGQKSRLICTKIEKDSKGILVKALFVNPFIPSQIFEYNLEELNVFSIYDPIDNTEFFSMYINWRNFYRDGVHQDLDKAYQIYLSILESLSVRSYVRIGTGAFVDYDYNLKNLLLGAYK